MIHLYRVGGIRKTESGIEYSIKAVNEGDRDLLESNGWVKSLSDLVEEPTAEEPTAEELAAIEAKKAEKAAKTKATKEANKLKKEAEELAKLEAAKAEEDKEG